ncbi:hypothetical protein BU14_0105s0018 [Porphyra umbilicalis]|uniref:Replication factor A protein 3 n=1 Tax=Porphyra umbilicalis TaxID=2786 RepID=A0A1X6PCF4_PORUM|nr:hypothetical protein BU14_0105s0018 [Porphyra umbilicalis]|eukprot:OSX78599.1 hypothetical protein BU14_0105s0018 [Porphyra umbilicalis]
MAAGNAGGNSRTAPFIKLSDCGSYAGKFVVVAGPVTAVAEDGYTVGNCLRVVPMDVTDEVQVEHNVLLVGELDSTGSTLAEKRMCTMLGPNFDVDVYNRTADVTCLPNFKHLFS